MNSRTGPTNRRRGSDRSDRDQKITPGPNDQLHRDQIGASRCPAPVLGSEAAVTQIDHRGSQHGRRTSTAEPPRVFWGRSDVLWVTLSSFQLPNAFARWCQLLHQPDPSSTSGSGDLLDNPRCQERAQVNLFIGRCYRITIGELIWFSLAPHFGGLTPFIPSCSKCGLVCLLSFSSDTFHVVSFISSHGRTLRIGIGIIPSDHTRPQ